MGYEVELRVTRGPKTITLSHIVEEAATSEYDYPALREAVRSCADMAVRAFPNPASPYSDDLFTIQRGGVVNAPTKAPAVMPDDAEDCPDDCPARCDCCT